MKFFKIRTVAFALGCCSFAQAASFFDFEAVPVGTTTQFSATSNGLSATFSSSGDPGGFVIQPSIFQALTGNALGDPGPAGLDNLLLNIGFNSQVNAIALAFATSDFGTAPSPFTLQAFLGNTLVGTATATGIVPGGFQFPEGKVVFAGGVFDRVVLSSTAADFAVDNISVSAVPEPATDGLLGLALIALGASRLFSNHMRRS